MNRRQLVATTLSVFLPTVAGCTDTLPDGGDASPPAGERGGNPPADRSLHISESVPVEGTMVDLGVEGTATNTASATLTDCVIHASGAVGGTRYSGVALRDRLDPGATWEWQITFGKRADARDSDAVENLLITTQAEYRA